MNSVQVLHECCVSIFALLISVCRCVLGVYVETTCLPNKREVNNANLLRLVLNWRFVDGVKFV